MKEPGPSPIIPIIVPSGVTTSPASSAVTALSGLGNGLGPTNEVGLSRIKNNFPHPGPITRSICGVGALLAGLAVGYLADAETAREGYQGSADIAIVTFVSAPAIFLACATAFYLTGN